MSRSLVLWFPDWAVTVTGHGPSELVALVAGERVVARSRAARTAGVALFERRRQVQQAFPELIAIERDEGLEARMFEQVVARVAELCVGVEIVRPGCLSLEVRGPARYFGGEEALSSRLIKEVLELHVVGRGPAPRVGIADGRFASLVAGRDGVIVEPGASAVFLSQKPVELLSEPELTGLLRRLGILTLGEFVALGERFVSSRFGVIGKRCYEMAQGVDDSPATSTRAEREIVATSEFDPPLERVEAAAFAVRSMAAELVNELSLAGLSCTRLSIEAETEHGEVLTRLWRSESSFSAEAIIERLRWQLEGWLLASTPEPSPSGGLSLVRLRIDETVPDVGRQLGFFGGASDADRRAARGFDRLRGLLGPDAVFTAHRQGGRGPSERVLLLPWGSPPPPERDECPWPGHHPLPAPGLVYETLLAATVLDDEGELVEVFARGRASSCPSRISIDGGPFEKVVGWTGPWLYEERWWDAAGTRRSRFQLLTESGLAHLCVLEKGRWFVEATYD